MALPWTQLLRWTPQIIAVSRELLQRSRREPAARTAVAKPDESLAALEARVRALEDNERQQAELVERMAEQQAELARALVALHRRERTLIVTVVLLALAVLGLGAWQIFLR